MTKRDADKILDDYLRGGSVVSKLYRAEALAGPPPALDRSVRAAAREATRNKGGFNPFAGRWYVPLSAAAVIAIAVGLTVFMQRDGVPPAFSPATETQDKMQADAARPSAPVPAADESRPRRVVQSEPLTKEAPPEVSAGRAETPREEASTSGPVEQKLAEAAAPRAAPGPLAAGAVAQKRKEAAMTRIVADVTAVRASGGAGAYQFSVTVRSPDTGCAQYADWWEVLSEDGRLLYRRVLLHSHVDEQPFTRGGGPVPVDAASTVIVRAHMNKAGYGGPALKGSVERGFAPVTLPAGFAADAATKPPLPEGCMF